MGAQKYFIAFNRAKEYLDGVLISFCDLKRNQKATESLILWPFSFSPDVGSSYFECSLSAGLSFQEQRRQESKTISIKGKKKYERTRRRQVV